MTKPSNPFDPLNLMQHFDPLKFMEQFGQTMQQFSPPGMPSQNILEQQRKNLIALTEANQALMKGAQEVMQRQMELLQQAATEAGKSTQKLQATDPNQLAVKQAELFNENYGKLVRHMQEVAVTLTQAHQQALQTLDKRWREVLDEFNRLG